jgi:hypothetical protein
MSVIVKPNPANLLYSNAGPDQTINYPTKNAATLNGSASYATNGGYVSRYAWTKVSGPSNANILNATAQKATVTFGAAGTYVFRLTVTDTYNNTATDEVTIFVGSSSDAKIAAVAPTDESINTASIQLYPNPAVSTLRLTIKLSEEATIVAKIFNSNGAIKGTYYLGSVTSIQKDIDVSGFVAGMYILQVTDGSSRSFSSKFIKAN